MDGALLTNSHGIYHITRKRYWPTETALRADHDCRSVGQVSGRGFCAQKHWPVTVKPGIYSVEVYMAGSSDDCFLAFASIRFRNNTPVAFAPAKTAYDLEHKRRPPFRYVVEDCRTGFMDADVFHAICALPRYARADNLLYFDDTEDEVFRCAVGNSEDGELTAALVTIRKSGVYYWYWGIDCNNEVCCLIADFFTYQ
ncbi:MAG: DUF4241 domain-containing protein [Oscillospiraceae bacterium]